MKRYCRYWMAVVAMAVMAVCATAAPRKAKTQSRAKGHAAAPHRASHGTAARGKTSRSKTSRGRAPAGKAARGRYARGKAVARGGRRTAPRQAGQASPTSDRYREIQEALAAKGYLKTAPNGVWDQDSMDAMRRFQEDQKLTSTGKLNSLSLIALGLGPKDKTAETPAK